MLTLASAEGAAAAATGITAYAWLLSPSRLLGALLLLVGGKRTNRFGPVLAVGLSWASFVLGFVIIIAMLGRDNADRRHARAPVRLVAGRSVPASTPAC